jgi:antitoxin (DNA-binding transcriptional repressor) of toxin-antitoxin stability system
MKTMTATQARQSLGTILSRVLQGEDIGIVHSGSGRIIALRPVEVYSEDYALIEYGLTSKQLQRAENKILSEIKKERKAGKLKRWRA